MPIGGFVVSVLPNEINVVKETLRSMTGCDVYDELQGSAVKNDSIIITLDTMTTGEMELLVEEIKKIDGVLAVDLAYLNIEDEVGE